MIMVMAMMIMMIVGPSAECRHDIRSPDKDNHNKRTDDKAKVSFQQNEKINAGLMLDGKAPRCSMAGRELGLSLIQGPGGVLRLRLKNYKE